MVPSLRQQPLITGLVLAVGWVCCTQPALAVTKLVTGLGCKVQDPAAWLAATTVYFGTPGAG